MQRVAGKNRYPIDVVKIPMAVPLTTAFKQNIERIRRERLPKELGHALQHQLRMVIKRSKHTELRAAVLECTGEDLLTPGATLFDGRPAVCLMRRIFPAKLPFALSHRR